MTIEDIAQNYGPSIAYTNWDGSSSTMCICDPGYTGPDCSYCKFSARQKSHKISLSNLCV